MAVTASHYARIMRALKFLSMEYVFWSHFNAKST
jgi:hypothetical protein